MSPACAAFVEDAERFPRVSGDEPADVDTVAGESEFSPRERG